MYKNPFFIGTPSGIPDISSATAHQNMMKLGLNTGNLLFATAAQTVLAPQGDKPVVFGQPEKLAETEGHDCIVVTAANWLQPRTDLGKIAKAIEESELPAFVIGLGAQSRSENSIPELSEGTRRFIDVVSERSTLLSVRGEFTAETLAHYGITNVEVTGCPSLLLLDPLPPRLVKRTGAPERITICGSRGLLSEATLTSKSPTHRLSRLFARRLTEDNVEFVAQAELPEIYFLLEGIGLEQEIRPEWIDFVERYYGLPIAELNPILQKKMKVFFDLLGWKAYLRGRDFVLGTRLHGVIAGLLSGTPSVLITHDTRTREMARNMMIPSVEAAQIGEALDYAAIYAAADFEQFNRRVPIYYEKFRAFFEANGLRHNLASAP